MSLKLRQAVQGLQQTFSRPRCLLIGLGAAFGAALVAAWVANAKVLAFALSTPLLTPEMKLLTVVQQLAATFVAFRPGVVALIIVTAVLFGVNIGLSFCYVSRRYELGRSMGMTLAGAIVAMLGVGCVSCGSVILFSIFGSGAAAVAIKHLPLEGLEFGIVGGLVMLVSVYLTAVKIPGAEACPMPVQKRPSQ